MKKTKILVPAIAVLALGIAATTTATVAWFSANSSLTLNTLASNPSTLTVQQTSTELSYQATLKLVYVVPAKSIELTGWYDHVLKTGTVVNSNNSDVTLSDAQVADETYAIEVKAWLDDTSTNKDETGHAASWTAAVDGLTTAQATKTVTFSYANADDSDALLLTSEVYFYTVKSTAASSTYLEASEGISGASGISQSIEINVHDLKSTSYPTAEANAVRVGWLYVRFDGKTRVHTPSTSYTATILANF